MNIIFRKLVKLWSFLDRSQKNRILLIQGFVILLAFLELITIGVVAYFMQLVTSTSGIVSVREKIPLLVDFNEQQTLIIVSFFLMLVLTFNSILSVILFRKNSYLGMEIGHSISLRLAKFYMSRDWIYHVNNNSNDMVNNVIVESSRLSGTVITQFIQFVSKLILVLIISLMIFIYNPIITGSILLFFVSCYLVISFLVRHKLVINGGVISKSNIEKLKAIVEAMDNVKVVILDNKKDYFLSKFERENYSASQAQASNMTLSSAPKYMMEWLAFSSMVMLIAVNLYVGKDFESLIPLLTVYGLTAFKVLPSLQQMYGSLSIIKGNIRSVDIVVDVINESAHENKEITDNHLDSINFREEIKLKNAYYKYPMKEEYAINGLDLTVRKNQFIGIVGMSGAGKSTLIDILCGLIRIEDRGDFMVDGNEVSDQLASWRKAVAYVPQAITLSDASIAENIAFGEDTADIDWCKMSRVVSQACLDDLVSSLSEGLNSSVGEKGLQLSGGQRQRIGIARALYKNAKLLVLDEATSALDGTTESEILAELGKIADDITIIAIAHRLNTVKSCDVIYMLQDGMVKSHGSYDELLVLDSEFKKMAKHA